MVATAVIAFMFTNYLEYIKLPTTLSSGTRNFQVHLLPSRHRAYLASEEGVFQASGTMMQKNRVTSALCSTLSVCIDNDCVQQGAMQSLGKLRAVAEPQGVEVDTCSCVGMCGLGPCVTISWDGSSTSETRGGVYFDDELALNELVRDALDQPRSPEARNRGDECSYDDDPYAEQ